MKGCVACPWLKKGQPDITDDLRKACHNGEWFCCHVSLGTCTGAELEREKNERKINKDESSNNTCK